MASASQVHRPSQIGLVRGGTAPRGAAAPAPGDGWHSRPAATCPGLVAGLLPAGSWVLGVRRRRRTCLAEPQQPGRTRACSS